LPPRRRLAGAVPLVRRLRHASGEHDCRRRASRADRSRNDPSGRRLANMGRRRGPGLRGGHGIIASSVISVGLLPAYGRSPNDDVFAMGGMTSDWTSQQRRTWSGINSDAMRPAKAAPANNDVANLPHVDGRYASFGDRIDDFVSGFAEYANYLLSRSSD